MTDKISKRLKRRKKIRQLVSGTKARPRFSVFRSNKHIFVQLVDDSGGRTILGLSDSAVKNPKGKSLTKIQKAKALGLLLAKAALDKKIKEVVFDRGGYRYHGRVRALAEGTREGGLIF
ncbi:MAG: 50S ribosomal protein L18 [Patescibacteria group bacterium]